MDGIEGDVVAGAGQENKAPDEAGKAVKQRDWLAEILLNATSDRRRINSIRLPDEPDFKDRPPRVDSQHFQTFVGGLMDQFGDKLEEAERKKKEELRAKGLEPIDETASRHEMNKVHTWSS